MEVLLSSTTTSATDKDLFLASIDRVETKTWDVGAFSSFCRGGDIVQGPFQYDGPADDSRFPMQVIKAANEHIVQFGKKLVCGTTAIPPGYGNAYYVK